MRRRPTPRHLGSYGNLLTFAAWFDKVEPTKERAMTLAIRWLTPDLWPALEDLFGKNGACNGCWCMYGRIGSAYRQRPREKNRAAFREVVKRGPPPGLL